MSGHSLCIDLTGSPCRKESDDEPGLATETRQQSHERRSNDEVIEIDGDGDDDGSSEEDVQVDPLLVDEMKAKANYGGPHLSADVSEDDDVVIIDDHPRPILELPEIPNPSVLLGKRKSALPNQRHPSKIIQAEKRRKKERRQYLEAERLKSEQAVKAIAEEKAKQRAAEEEAKREAARRNFIIIDDSSDEEDDDDEVEVQDVELPPRTPVERGSPNRHRRRSSTSPRARPAGGGQHADARVDEDIPVQPNGFQRRRRSGEGCRPYVPRKPGTHPSYAYRFDNRRDYNWNFSQEEALEYQERLFREAAERLRKQNQDQTSSTAGSSQHQQQYYNDHVLHSTRNSHGIPLITEPMHDIATRYPLHYSWARDPHAVLGLPHGSALSLVRTQYRRLAKLYHPDKSKTPATILKFHGISRAYRKLTAES
jgi:DnaJ domain